MSYKANKVQMGLESVAGTLVAATRMWDGEAEFEFLDEIVTPEYMSGEPGGAVEDAFIAGTGSRLTLKDTPASFQTLAHLLNMGVKAVVGPATSFPFTFPIPGTLTNTPSTFTWEVAIQGQVTQEYEFGYGFASKWGLHGDAKANGGQVYLNGVIEGRKAAASTLTASLAFVPSREMMNLRTASWDLNALGTAFETTLLASPITGTLRGFSIECTDLFAPGYYASARADKDFATLDGGSDYKLAGKVKGLLNSSMVTEIANARSATGKIMQLWIPGTSTLVCDLRLPILWSSVPKLLSDVEDGMQYVEFDFISRYSRTTTAQGASVNLTLASTTIT
jgi:hypothetical protein